MGKVTLLCGPQGCGKTETVVNRYVEQVQQAGSDSVLLLLPTARMVSDVSQRLLRAGLVEGLVDARLLTFPSLADMLLRANYAQAPEVSDLQRWLLMHQVIDALGAAGELTGMGTTVTTSGLVDALLGFVDELKRAAISPEQFAAGLGKAGLQRPLDSALTAVYTHYQQVLTARRLYDAAGKFWQARDLLKDGNIAPLERMQYVFVDGFSDFTTTELQVLGHLATIAEQTTISLSLHPDTTRGQLRRLPERTLQRLQALMPSLVCEQLPESGHCDDALAFLRSHLFALRPPAPPEDCVDRVRLLVAGSIRDEVRSVAAEVKRLLLDGVPASDICVACRQPHKYRDVIGQVFDEQGIVHHFSGTDGVVGQPLVRTVVSMLSMVAGDFRREDVVNFLRGDLVDLSCLQDDEGRPDADTVYTIACRAGIVGGQEQWKQGLELYCQRLSRHREALQRGLDPDELDDDLRTVTKLEAVAGQLRDAQAVAGLFSRLAEHGDELPARATAQQHVAALAALMERFGLRSESLTQRSAGALLSSDNLRGFDELCTALADYLEVERLGLAVAQSTRQEFVSQLLLLLGRLSFRPHRQRQGRVAVLDLFDLRQSRIPYLFVLDMSQGSFPLVQRQDPFYHEADRSRLSGQAGFDLRTGQGSEMAEASLFHEAISAAAERLHLSYTNATADGNPVLASQYFDEVARLVEPVCQVRERAKTLVSPRPLEAYSVRQLRDCVFSRLFASADEPCAEDGILASWNLLVERDAEVLQAAVASTLAELTRHSDAPFDCHDGVLDDPQLLEYLAAAWGTEHMYSASQLSSYGSCPFMFFASRVLGLGSVDEPDEEVDRRAVGALVHRVLAGFLRSWATDDSHDPAITHANVSEAEILLESCARQVLQGHERSNLVVHARLWEMLKEQLLADLAALPAAEAKTNSTKAGLLYVPWMQEADYGYEGNPPLVLTEDDEEVRIGGRIDRLDRVVDAQGNVLGFAVFDYKTSSSLPTGKELSTGQDLQLPIYIMAAERLLADDERHLECHLASYYQIRSGRAQRRVQIKPDDKRLDRDTLVSAAQALIPCFVRAICAGRFPVSPAGESHCGYCDFNTMCRHTDWRCRVKTGGEPGDQLSTPS